MAESCSLCFKPGTNRRKLVNHHYRGVRLYPKLTMRVHHGSCHDFGDFITTLYTESGRVDSLEPRDVTWLYQRTMTMREGKDFILPIEVAHAQALLRQVAD